jgi:hypothetical protein
MKKATPHPYEIVKGCNCGYCRQEQELLDSGLTKDEKKVMDHLTDAWNMFMQLPIQHGSDVPEFQQSIHQLQYLLGMRLVRRAHPKFWVNEDKNE